MVRNHLKPRWREVKHKVVIIKSANFNFITLNEKHTFLETLITNWLYLVTKIYKKKSGWALIRFF